MNRITADPVSFTTHHLHMCFTQTDTVLSSATGFIYTRNALHYLITNWHNVSGRNPLDGCCLSDTAAVPDAISTIFRERGNLGKLHRHLIPLYLDDEMSEPRWLEHPNYGKSVDVVAIPLLTGDYDSYQLFPINEIEFDTAFRTEVSDDAFVIGFPFADPPDYLMPIWKRASVASEPDIDFDKLPKLLVDTATRSGLSGSPVVMQRVGIHGATGAALTGSEMIGRIRNFIGVYSGRVGADEMKAQLGVVWKKSVIDEIIDQGACDNEAHLEGATEA